MLIVVGVTQYRDVQKRLEAESELFALHVQSDLQGASEDDVASLSKSISARRLHEGIARVCLYGANGALLVERSGPNGGACATEESASNASADQVAPTAAITVNADPVMTLHAFVSRERILREVTDAMIPIVALGLLVLLVASVLGRRLAAREVKPLRALTHSARALGRGQLSVRMSEAGPEEVRDLARAYNAVIDDLLSARRAAETDITERRRAQEALAGTEALLRNIVDHVPYLIFAVRRDGSLLFANRALARAYGTEPEHLIDGTFFAERTRHPDGLLITAGTAKPNDEIWFEHVDGVRRLIVSRVPFDAGVDETVDADLVIAVDITEERRLQVQLQFSQRLEVVGTLAGGIAHDFNNLLTPIMGYSTVLMDRQLPDDSAAKVKAIYGAALKARDLVQQILTFSRRGAETAQKGLIDPAEVLEDAMALMRATIPSSIAIDVDIDPSTPAIHANPGQIHQVVANLCTNAAQAMTGAHGEIRVRLSQERDEVVLRVADTGAGMPPEILDRIFEPFFTTKDIGHGSGLGLSVVHGIVTDHGGTITVTSEVGRGSEFTVRLPSARKHTIEIARPAPSPARHNERVMLVDDDDSVVRASRDLLENLGYQVQAFTQAETALRRLQEDPDAIDAIVTDNLMPGMTGLEFALAARKLRKDIPVVLMSGFLDDAAERSPSITMSIMKPVSGRELSAAIQRAIRTDRAA